MSRPKSRKLRPKSKSAASSLLGQLSLLSQRRAPYLGALRPIFQRTLEAFPLGEAGPRGEPESLGATGRLVEIGAGTGQLLQLLPEQVSARLVCTDPSAQALALIASEAQHEQTLVARAESLPFASAELDGVLGLCVFDALDSPAAAVTELARVLRPGGRFVHFLDMATLLHAPFLQLARAGLVPLPNVMTDPSDSEWPLDILLVRKAVLQMLLAAYPRLGQALAPSINSYFREFFAVDQDAHRAASAFHVLAGRTQHRRALLGFFDQAASLATAQGLPALSPVPFHSGRYLHSVMTEAFGASDAFEIEQAAIQTHGCLQKQPQATHRYRSLCLGHQRLSRGIPRRMLDPAFAEQVKAHDLPDESQLVEAGVFVFVARRI